MPISQGSNAPLIVSCDKDVSGLSKILLSLWHPVGNNAGKLLKKWEKDDVQIRGKTILCPLQESETVAFPGKTVVLYVKGTDSYGQVRLWKEIEIKIDTRWDSIFHITEA